ncbi:MAG: hypothetical protein XD94_1696, partial [Mesotoga prima]
WEEPEVRGKRSEERRDLDLLTSSLIPLTSDPPQRTFKIIPPTIAIITLASVPIR